MTARATTKEPAGDEDKPAPADVEFDFRSITFTIPRRRGRWPTQALWCFQAGGQADIAGIRILLGEKQWKALCAIAPFGDDLEEFRELLGKIVEEQVVA